MEKVTKFEMSVVGSDGFESRIYSRGLYAPSKKFDEECMKYAPEVRKDVVYFFLKRTSTSSRLSVTLADGTIVEAKTWEE